MKRSLPSMRAQTADVELWAAFSDEIRDPALLARYRELLTEDERAREMRFRFASDQHRFLLTRALVRTALSKYADVAPDAWRFVPDAFGRPQIQNTDAGVADITFNISHTHGLIILGVAHRKALGIDTEHLWSRTASAAVADRFFSPSEAEALREMPEAVRRERFFDYWTLKESYIKARGRGLSLGLASFGFDLGQPKRISAWFRPEVEDAAPHWQFWQFNPSPDHVAAVCLQRVSELPQHLLMRKVVPLEGEQVMPVEILRQSV
jgi:4'-phosphopantetheinyl transferase